MIDEKWANQTHIEEDKDARAYLINAAQEDGRMYKDANDEKHLAFELAKDEDYYDSDLNNSHTIEIENQGAAELIKTGNNSELHKIDKGWIKKYATEDGHNPYVDGIASGTADAISSDVKETLDAISNLTTEKVGNALVVVAENIYDTLTDLETYKPEYTESDRGSKEIAEAQGNKDALIEINKAEYIDDAETVVTITTLGVGTVVKGAGKEVLEEVVEQARKEAKSSDDNGTMLGRDVVPDKIDPKHLELVTSHQNAHAIKVHGGDVTDGQLVYRAKSGIKPNLTEGPSVPPLSSAFHSDELLIHADQAVRNSGALEKAIARQPGQAAIRVTVDDAGDLGVDLGRGYKRVYGSGNKVKNRETHGAPVRVDNLRSVEGFYMLNPNTNTWETISIFPAPLR